MKNRARVLFTNEQKGFKKENMETTERGKVITYVDISLARVVEASRG
jgi:hypothetical protein